MKTSQSLRRQPRADARRNYERLLAEADAAFREHGTGAPLDAIARSAGVAIGTLYGHFPSRRALVSALLKDRNDALFDLGTALLAAPSSGDALQAWMLEATRHAAAYRGLADLLAEGIDDEASELHSSCLRMSDFTVRLTARARADGVLRPEVTAADISAFVSAASWTAERMSMEQAERLLGQAMQGLSQPAS